MIKLQVIGHLGKDVQINQVGGKSVMNFNVAHSEKFKDAQGNQKEKTTWVDAAYWTDKTGIAPYLKKGTLVYVEGTPEVRTYAKNDGTTGSSLTLRVNTVQLLGGGGGNNSGNNSNNSGSYGNQGPSNDVPDDDLPF
jgi:single-strand DNA-binding protein